MPYGAEDKYQMSLRQAKVDIGQGRGNAMTNAVNLAIALLQKGVLTDKYEEFIFEMCDRIFQYNQGKIDADFKQWFEANNAQLCIDTGMDVPSIDVGEAVNFPKK